MASLVNGVIWWWLLRRVPSISENTALMFIKIIIFNKFDLTIKIDLKSCIEKKFKRSKTIRLLNLLNWFDFYKNPYKEQNLI